MTSQRGDMAGGAIIAAIVVGVFVFAVTGGVQAEQPAGERLDDGPRDVIIGPEPLRIDPQEALERQRRIDAEQREAQRRQQQLRERQVEAAEEEEQRTPLPHRPLEEIRAMTAPELEQFVLHLLVQASMSEYPQHRSNAVEALQGRPERALPVTHRLLEDPNPAVRFAAVVTAGMLEFEDLVPAIRPLLEDDHPAVRGAALSTLHVLGERVNLTPLADMLESRDPALRGNVAMLLGLLGNRSAVPMLKRAAVAPMPRASAAETAVARVQIAEAIARLDDDAGLNSLRGSAYSQFDEVRVVAVIAMGAVQDRRMEVAIESMLESPPMELQLAAAGTLARLGNYQGAEITAELAGYEHPVIRAQAAWVLGWFEGGESLEILKRLLADDAEPVRVAAAASLLRRTAPPARAEARPAVR